MLHYTKKYFSVLLLTSMLPIYGMDNNWGNDPLVNLCTTIATAIAITVGTYLYDAYKQHRSNNGLKNELNIALKNNSLPNWKKIEEYLKNGANVNCTIGSLKQTLLMIAVKHRQRKLVNYLLKHGADLEICNAWGNNLLHDMLTRLETHSQKIDIQLFETLLKKGADPNAQTKNGLKESPLSSAAERNGNINFIKLLIKYGANINHKDSIYTPLGWAINNENSAIIKELCDNGVILRNIDHQDNTVFHIFAQKKAFTQKNEQIIKMIITRAHFTNKEIGKNNETIENRLIDTFLLLKSQHIPTDLRFKILSKIISLQLIENKKIYVDLYGANRGFYRQLVMRGCTDLLICEVHKRADGILALLKIDNKEKNTALQILNRRTNQCIQIATPLLNGSELKNDLLTFDTKYPDILNSELTHNNLACQTYKNCINLLYSNN